MTLYFIVQSFVWAVAGNKLSILLIFVNILYIRYFESVTPKEQIQSSQLFIISTILFLKQSNYT